MRSITTKLLVPMSALLVVLVAALVFVSNRALGRQQLALSQETAEVGVSILQRSLAYSMAQGGSNFDPLLDDFEQRTPHVQELRLVDRGTPGNEADAAAGRLGEGRAGRRAATRGARQRGRASAANASCCRSWPTPPARGVTPRSAPGTWRPRSA